VHRRVAVTVAVLLAVETKSLIIGESALPEQPAVIEKALLSARRCRSIPATCRPSYSASMMRPPSP
jgi:hypothetical protein